MEIIEDEFSYLTNLWQEYKILFSNEDNLNILNKKFGNCFHTIQHSMNNDMILSLNRLLDPYHQGTNKNLVLETLLDRVSDEEKRRELEGKLNVIRQLRDSSNLKEIRHKRLAHSDKKTRNEDGNFIMILINYDTVENIINLISEFLNEINFLENRKVEYFESDTYCQDLVNALDI